MGNLLRRIFCPTPEEVEEDLRNLKKIHDQQAKEKGCSTCEYCKHVIDYPGFVTGEESVCTEGLECDTVLFSVKNCSKWKDGWKRLKGFWMSKEKENEENTHIVQKRI